MQKTISWLATNGCKTFSFHNLSNLKQMSSLIQKTDCNGTIYILKYVAEPTVIFSKFIAILFHRLFHIMLYSYSKSKSDHLQISPHTWKILHSLSLYVKSIVCISLICLKIHKELFGFYREYHKNLDMHHQEQFISPWYLGKLFMLRRYSIAEK